MNDYCLTTHTHTHTYIYITHKKNFTIKAFFKIGKIITVLYAQKYKAIFFK